MNQVPGRIYVPGTLGALSERYDYSENGHTYSKGTPFLILREVYIQNASSNLSSLTIVLIDGHVDKIYVYEQEIIQSPACG